MHFTFADAAGRARRHLPCTSGNPSQYGGRPLLVVHPSASHGVLFGQSQHFHLCLACAPIVYPTNAQLSCQELGVLWPLSTCLSQYLMVGSSVSEAASFCHPSAFSVST